MHGPQRAAAVQHGHVQAGHHIVQGLTVVLAFGQLVEKDVLVQVYLGRIFPTRHRVEAEVDGAVERRFDRGGGQVFLVQIFSKRGG